MKLDADPLRLDAYEQLQCSPQSGHAMLRFEVSARAREEPELTDLDCLPATCYLANSPSFVGGRPFMTSRIRIFITALLLSHLLLLLSLVHAQSSEQQAGPATQQTTALSSSSA